MKGMKRIFSALLAVLLFLATATTVLADNNGQITVNGATTGKTYDVYKIFDLTKSATGTNVSYTIDPDWVNFFIGAGAPGAAYLAQTATPGLNQLTHNGTTYYINITDSNIAAFAQAALAYAAAKPADDTKVATGTTVQFTGLPLGYYLVYPQGATDIGGSYGSICSLTSTVPTATVNVKATYPEIEKSVNDQDVEVGQTVTFTVTGKVPDTTGYASYKYEVKDTMSPGLTFNNTTANFSVKFGGTPISVAPSYASNGFTLSFDMVNYQQYKGQAITITYSAVVNKNAVVTLTKNSATLEYSNDPMGGTTTTPPVEKEVYTSKIVVDKYDASAPSKKLPDASFILVKKSGGVESFYKYDAATDTVSWVSDMTQATVKKTDSQGALEFIGLSDGTYYLRETIAPQGFNLLDHDVEVKITHTTTSGGGGTFGIGVSQKSEIPNKSGTTLPETGGIGTTLFYAVGGLLLVGTVTVFITRRKLRAERK
ncbi:SpaH/EbpB family LPXTG-anchored major pilin [Lachnoclostridium sp. Marseille-P6806]|uniref:SpaH/EbpB family LPXTG-anchored major pilin n=1 Tax=Lachnoclostridium sp. Marseille-P6806 TaxID=2364793 RepID=UPI001030ABD2|nr:SpaH/EbpB family LPXTG-anchored major pilin [Lachnoclostridium sp. Marseille-P6806]